MSFWFLLCTVRKDLLSILSTAVAFILLYNFWFIDVPEIFHNAAKWGALFERLAMSYVSAFVFYFLAVHYKAQKDKVNLRFVVVGLVTQILSINNRKVNDLALHLEINVKGKYPDADEINSTLKKFMNGQITESAPNDVGWSALGGISWYHYYAKIKKHDQEVITKLYELMPYLDTELVKHLHDLNECYLFRNLEQDKPLTGETYNLYSVSLRTYYKELGNLSDYYVKKLFPHVKKSMYGMPSIDEIVKKIKLIF